MKHYKRIAIFVGHSLLKSGTYTSAQGVKNEYLYNKQLGAELKDLLDSIGQPCDLIICPEYRFTSSSQEDNYKLPIANSGKYDLIIELHLNSYNGEATGAEVLCYPASNSIAIGERVQKKLSTAFRDRDIIKTSKYYMLRETYPTAIMVESFFCDSKSDCAKADKLGVQGVAKLIAEGVADTTIKVQSEGFQKGSYHKNVRITASPSLRVRSGRGTGHSVLTKFPQGKVVEVWYISTAKDGSLWGSCESGKYDANGKAITGFIHMGFVEKVK